jgi:hypothetical protein
LDPTYHHRMLAIIIEYVVCATVVMLDVYSVFTATYNSRFYYYFIFIFSLPLCTYGREINFSLWRVGGGRRHRKRKEVELVVEV